MGKMKATPERESKVLDEKPLEGLSIVELAREIFKDVPQEAFDRIREEGDINEVIDRRAAGKFKEE